MSRSFEFSVPFDSTPEAVHRALTDERLWQSRFGQSDTADIEVTTPEGPGTAVVSMVEHVGGDRIPGLVRKVLRGDLSLHRTDRWGPIDGDSARGTFTGGSTGIGSEFDGTYVLRPNAAGAVLEVSARVKVKVRLVGGAIEGLVEQMFTKLIKGEGKYTEKWIAEQH